MCIENFTVSNVRRVVLNNRPSKIFSVYRETHGGGRVFWGYFSAPASMPNAGLLQHLDQQGKL